MTEVIIRIGGKNEFSGANKIIAEARRASQEKFKANLLASSRMAEKKNSSDATNSDFPRVDT